MKELVIANSLLIAVILIESFVNLVCTFKKENDKLKGVDEALYLSILKQYDDKLNAIAQKKNIYYIQYDPTSGQFNKLVEITPEEAWSLRAEMRSEHKEAYRQDILEHLQT